MVFITCCQFIVGSPSFFLLSPLCALSQSSYHGLDCIRCFYILLPIHTRYQTCQIQSLVKSDSIWGLSARMPKSTILRHLPTLPTNSHSIPLSRSPRLHTYFIVRYHWGYLFNIESNIDTWTSPKIEGDVQK